MNISESGKLIADTDRIYRDRQENQLQVPLKISDVTKEWLTDALSVRFPDTKVTSLHFGSITHGTSTRIRLLLEYNEQGHAYGLPPTMHLKMGLEEGQHDAYDDGHHDLYEALYLAEVLFYQKLANELPANIPKCFFAGWNRGTKQSAILMEDLLARNVSFGRITQPISHDTVKATLDMMARYHAYLWDSPRLQEWNFRPSAEASLDMINPETWDYYLSLPRGAAAPKVLRDREVVKKAVLSLWEFNSKPPCCFLHYDPHAGNLFFERDGTPGLVDWSAVSMGHWAHDVTYFMVGVLDIPDRRKMEKDLLEYYLEKLSAGGVAGPSWDDAWLAYRRHVIHGFLWIGCPPELQNEQICELNSLRYSTAAGDLKTVDSLL